LGDWERGGLGERFGDFVSDEYDWDEEEGEKDERDEDEVAGFHGFVNLALR